MWFPSLIGTKVKVHCAVCNKELTKFRYKPRDEWDINGMLCGDCHVMKSMEYSEQPKGSESRRGQETIKDEKEISIKCGLCNTDIGSASESHKPKWQWNLDTSLILCKRCYSMKGKEYEKRINYCAICGNKMPFFRYNPKPKWKIDGQLCRKCWDDSNNNWKS
jgi:hypothetical protein